MQKDLTALLGPGQCLFDLEDRWTYAFDAGADQAVPLAVVFAHTPKDVCSVMQYAAIQRIAVVPRGAGSGLTGGAVPAMGGIVLVLERMNRILEIDTDNLCAIVETGVITGTLQKAVEKKGLFYPPDPASAGFPPSAAILRKTPEACGPPNTGSPSGISWAWRWCFRTDGWSRWDPNASKMWWDIP